MDAGKIGIYFGTNSGTTRLIAKKLAKRFGESVVDPPLNVNRVSVHQFLAHPVLILGTPSYGQGDLPSAEAGSVGGSWKEFLAQLEEQDFEGRRVAFFGLGDQVKYKDQFASALGKLWRFFDERGAKTVGRWSCDGYEFQASEAASAGTFCGLVVDNQNQSLLTDGRLEVWTEQVKRELSLS